MSWIVLAALGVLLGLVLGELLYTLWSRRRLRRTPGVFRCRVRAGGPMFESRWPRTMRYGCWVHDVLLVRRGPTLARCEALAVSNVTGPVVSVTIKGLGERPVWLRLHLDDGRLVDLTARNGDVSSAIGPFMVASLS
jgi:hypothetical protein